MARAEMPYAVEKSNKRISNEMLTQSQQQERSMQYPNTQKPEKVTSRLGTFPSLRNGCLPTSRLIHDGCLPSHEVGKTALPYLTDPDFEQRTSPEPDFAPPSKHSSRKSDSGAHSSRHSKSREPPLPTTVRQAHPERKTVPTLCPKVREPPPPIEVRRSNPNVNTVPVLTPKVREPVPRKPSPEAGSSHSSSSRSHSGSGSKSGKRGRRRKRDEEDYEAPSTSGLHYTVESDKNKPFTLRLKINRINTSTSSSEPCSSKSTPHASDKKSRNFPSEVTPAEERWKKAGGSRDGFDSSAERKDSKRAGHGKKSAPPCIPSQSSGKKVPAVEKNRTPEPPRVVRSVRIKEPEPCSSNMPSTSYKARTSFSSSSGKIRNESSGIKEQTPNEQCLSDDTCKPKGRRKKGYNPDETMNELPPLVPDKVRTPVPEVTRGPRIKTLQEILDSLNIQLDDSSRFDARSQPGGSRELANGSMATSNGHWDRHVSRTEQPRKRSKNQTAPAALQAPAHSEGGETSKMEGGVNGSEENPDDSSKRIKIIISGEVSRRPTKPLNCSTGNSSKAPRASAASRESGENSDDDDEQDESDSDSNERKVQKERERVQKQERKKRVKMMAKKQEAGDREELKEILQARCSLRKEISMDEMDDASDETESKAKVASRKPGSAPDSSRKPRPPGITSPRDSDSEEEKSVADGKGGGETDQWEKSMSSAEESSEQSAYESPVMKSVEEILSKLPPISETPVDLSDPSEDVCCTPMSSMEVERIVERMSTECIEGITGTMSHEGQMTFREWHETAIRPARNGESLVLLPYVVID